MSIRASLLLLAGACTGTGPASTDSGAAAADTATPLDSAADSAPGDTADTASGVGTPLDPLGLAAEVSAENLEQTVTALADLGTRYTFTSGDEAAAEYLTARFEALGLVVEPHGFSVDGTVATNLVVVLPGTVTPDLVYVFSAHYDSTSDDPEHLAPGADDNASSVAAVLEAARILSAHPLRSTAWFVLTAAEEQGSLGSAALVEEMLSEGVSARAVMAPDMIGYWPAGEGDALDILGDSASEPLVEQMAATADALGVASKSWIHHDYCYGDDHTGYQDAGFPAISPMDCVEAHNLPRSGETTPNYHRTTDTPATVDFAFTASVARVTTATFAAWVVPTTE